jgi:hypothetical protein
MPSSPGYVRNDKHEDKIRMAKPGERQENRDRKKARRVELKRGLVHPHDGMDVDHRDPLSKGGSTADSNLRVESAHKNRSYARTKKGAIK